MKVVNEFFAAKLYNYYFSNYYYYYYFYTKKLHELIYKGLKLKFLSYDYI